MRLLTLICSLLWLPTLLALEPSEVVEPKTAEKTDSADEIITTKGSLQNLSPNQEEKTANEQKAAKETTSQAALSSSLTIGSLVPMGTVQRGLRIPNLEDGFLASLIEAEVMTRENEEHLSFENMTITLFRRGQDASEEIKTEGENQDQATVDYRIEMQEARYLLEDRLLEGEKSSKVSNESFVMTGDTLNFDTQAGRGSMTGNIVMTVFDSESSDSNAPATTD